MKGSKKALDLASVNLLEVTPVQIAPWEEAAERVVIERPKPRLQMRTAGEWCRYWLVVRRIRLDERGSFIWQQFDGRTTVGQIAEATRQRFGEAAEPVEERVGILVRMLRQEGFLAYVGWDPEAEPEYDAGGSGTGC
jgi:hypothetical protein